MDNNKLKAKNRRGQIQRIKELNAIAQELGFKSWTALGTAAKNKEIVITVEQAEK